MTRFADDDVFKVIFVKIFSDLRKFCSTLARAILLTLLYRRVELLKIENGTETVVSDILFHICYHIPVDLCSALFCCPGHCPPSLLVTKLLIF